MKQLQSQSLKQELSLTLSMRQSLQLLSFGQQEVLDWTSKEARRNPFLKAVPSCVRTPSSSKSVEIPASEDARAAIAAQVGLIRLETAEDAEIARHLVHYLNDQGFLEDGPGELAKDLGTSEARIEKIVTCLQDSVEPVGVFAWSLKNCFRLQLQAGNRFDPVISELLERLDLVARQDVDAICEALDVEPDDAEEMLDDIRRLCAAPMAFDPIPFDIPSEPELIFSEDVDGNLIATLNEAALPQLLIDDGLFSTKNAIELDDATLAYYRDCHQSAGQLVAALQKRANTLLKIGSAFVSHQGKFLQTGMAAHKKPLSMSELASELGLHKSTISRALRDCRAKTPRGTISTHELLARDINSASEGRTQEQAIRRLQNLIRTEDARYPLPDIELADQMSRLGFTLSRRTVAKYRRIAGIPNAHRRRSQTKQVSTL